jgi:succinate dehydrogenase / fumarate reductase cytochrome b subunit
MPTSLHEQPLKRRPEYRNIHVTNLIGYRLPAPGWVSILHRVSGASLFLLLPFVVWLFDTSVTSETSYERFTSVFAYGAWGLPGVVWKLVAVGAIWAYVFHFTAGLRHLWMDATHAVGLHFGRVSAITVLVLSSLVTLALAAKLLF